MTTSPRPAFTLPFASVSARDLSRVGGKGAERLLEATRILSEAFETAFLRAASNAAPGLFAMGILRELAERGFVRATPEDLAAIERGLQGNVTTEMDLAVGDLIDKARAHAEVLASLSSLPPREAIAAVRRLDGARDFIEAWDAFLERYGMRGPGEVDLSRPRYRDDPGPLIATILGAATSGRADGDHRARHARLQAEAEAAIDRILTATRATCLGRLRAAWARRLIHVARAGTALREHPKFMLVRLLALVRDEVKRAGAELVRRQALARADDVFLFRFDELRAALDAPNPPDLRDEASARRAVLERDAHRTPPPVMASDGEIPALAPRTDLPPGALAGTGASAGVVEGLARVILDPAGEVLHDGEILVAPHTDPGWTPLFIHAAGLVTEVGGIITHGSVVAREYGIPAVVSVADATRRIRTGQRLRVDGTRGVVEVLDGGAAGGTAPVRS